MLKSTSDVSAEELRELAETKSPACVSIFMPAHRAGSEQQQDPIRLRNLGRRAGPAAQILAAAG